MRLVVAEDSALLRAGLVELLTSSGFEVVGHAADAETALTLVRETRPDAVVPLPRSALPRRSRTFLAPGQDTRSVIVTLT